MTFLGSVIKIVFDALPMAIVFPFPLFLLLMFLIGSRRRLVEQRFLGRYRTSLWREIAGDAIQGIVAGFVVSVLTLYLGITINTDGLTSVFLVSILLMLFDLRFLCLSYGAGIMALISLATGLPKLHIPGLLALVAMLHLAESGLILTGGDQRAVPVYLKRADGTVGGYLLQRLWPMPLLVLSMIVLTTREGLITIPNPAWWPLIPMNMPQAVFATLPVSAALGYGDLAVTSSPRWKAVRTAGLLAAFSIILLALAAASARFPVFAWPAAFFSPAGHELVLFISRRMELRGRPFHAHSAAGVAILAILPGSRAEQAGLRSGDTIVRLNGHPVLSRAELSARLRDADGGAISLEVVSAGGRERSCEFREEMRQFGIVPAPDPDDQAQVELGPWRFWSRRRGSL